MQADDLLFTMIEHWDYLKEAIATAGTSLFISSATISTALVDIIKGELLEALRRGCSVAWLWGSAALKAEARECNRMLSTIPKEARRN